MSQKILHMSGLPLKQLFLKNLRKSASVPEALTTTYLSLAESVNNQSAHQDFAKGPMEPYVEAYYGPTGGSACDIPLAIAMDGLARQNVAQSDPGEAEAFAGAKKSYQESHAADKRRYKSLRRWKRSRKEKAASRSEEYFLLRLLSFNILAQHLLEAYPYLYKEHDKEALPWTIRRTLLLDEIVEAKANVICLQEMQEDHLQEFLTPLEDLGYAHLYKKRTNDKKDGLLLLYRADQLVLSEHAKVELYQSGIELLSRDNVAIVAKFGVKESPDTQVVVATTHLLYNPKRNDVRLGQTQLLLAEIERIAFTENTMTGPKYLPIILAGDFNLEPYTGVYRFITEGLFEYKGKGRNLEYTNYRCLSNSLIPPRLCITDNCQHYNVLTKRMRGEGTGEVMLENTERCALQEPPRNASAPCEINTDTSDAQAVEVVRGQRALFSSGTLTHPFSLRSVYQHQREDGRREATTHQGEWITVDYVFYSDLEPVEEYSLPTTEECATLPTIPNFAVGSDHLCLGVSFKLFKRPC